MRDVMKTFILIAFFLMCNTVGDSIFCDNGKTCTVDGENLVCN
jgi:hypothetical protein